MDWGIFVAALAVVLSVLGGVVGVYVGASKKIAVNEARILAHEDRDNERIARIEAAAEKNTDAISQLAIHAAKTQETMLHLANKLDKYIDK